MHIDAAARAARHAALGDPVRLAIVDELLTSDRSPVELRRLLGVDSNLLSHHVEVLERVGLITRSRSSGDGRRRYVRLAPGALADLVPRRPVEVGPALFICTRNSARSQLAAVLWRSVTGVPASSAGTHPATRVHPFAVAAARRAGIDLDDATPRSLDEVAQLPHIVVTVCDQAHEELHAPPSWLHWSLQDPVAVGRASAFDGTVAELRRRIEALAVVT